MSERYVVGYGRARGAVLVKDTRTGDVRATYVTGDALYNATVEAARLNREEADRG